MSKKSFSVTLPTQKFTDAFMFFGGGNFDIAWKRVGYRKASSDESEHEETLGSWHPSAALWYLG